MRNSLKRSRVCVMLFIILFHFPFYSTKKEERKTLMLKNIRCRWCSCINKQLQRTHRRRGKIFFLHRCKSYRLFLHLIIPGFLIYFIFGIHFTVAYIKTFPTRQLYDVLPCTSLGNIFLFSFVFARVRDEKDNWHLLRNLSLFFCV